LGRLRLVWFDVELGHGLDLHVTALQLPLVILLQQDGPDEPDDGLFVGEDANHVRPPFHLFIQPFQWIGAVQLDPVLCGESHVGQHVVFGFVHEAGELWPFPAKLIGDMPPCLAGAGRIRLQKGLAQGGRDHGVLGLGDAGQGVAHPVDSAPLPRGSERLGDRGLEAFMRLLGFRFAPRIRDLGDTKLYIPKGDDAYDALKPMIGGTLNIKHVRAHWDEILRLATSIRQGTVTASLMLRKLGSYPRQNGIAVALRELGRFERTLFILDWLQSVELRRRVHAGLNKGEARNALARAIFFNRLGEIRDRCFEQQRYRASGLNLVTAAIVLWNTVYLERAANALRGHGQMIDDALLQYLSPLGWEHINLTGDYLWRSSAKIGAGKFRPLRPLNPA